MSDFINLDVPDGAVAIHWFEQSSFAIKSRTGTTILVDPYFPKERPSDRFIYAQPPVEEADFPTDLVLLTHDHGDHTCVESLQRLENAWQPKCYIGPIESLTRISNEMTSSLQSNKDVSIQISIDDKPIEGFSHSVSPGQKTVESIAGQTIDCVLNDEKFTIYPVYSKPPNGDSSADIDPPDVTHLGYVVDVSGVKVYISGDPINNFADHDSLVQPILALQPDIGFLTTHPTEGEFPFFDGSLSMAQRLKLKHAVPTHRACFVTRDYDPQLWANIFGEDSPTPLIMERNTHIVYPT